MTLLEFRRVLEIVQHLSQVFRQMMQRCSMAPVIVYGSFLTFDRLRLPGDKRHPAHRIYLTYSLISLFLVMTITAQQVTYQQYIMHGRVGLAQSQTAKRRRK